MQIQRLCVVVAFLGLAAGVQAQEVEDAGRIPGRFVQGGARTDFLKELKAAVANHQDKWYADEFPSLIAALEREPEVPAGYDKPAGKRTAQEAIAASVYDLRDAGTSWGVTNGSDAVSRLVAAGPAALEALVGALDDDTPARQMGFEVGASRAIVLRRSDLALTCIERISGINFFRRTQGRGGYFHNDAQRASVAENVRNWWKQAKGKSQVEGLRVQLGLWGQNTTLSNYGSIYEAEILYKLAQLEPPDRVIGRLRELCAADTYGLNSPITEYMMNLDPQFLLRQVFTRLKEKKVQKGDYYPLLKYGDKAVYEELCRRAADGALDPGSWELGGQTEMAAEYGKNWAIPMVALVLSKTEMTGGRYLSATLSQRFCAADDAVVEFQKLTHKDFGYKAEASEEQRLAAIKAARDWWEGEGKKALAEAIAADHPSVMDGTDLRATDEEIAAVAARIGSPDAKTAREAVPALGVVYAYRTQEALVARLGAETDARERVAILNKLKQPAMWAAPTLAGVFEKDGSMEVRAAAGEVLLRLIDADMMSLWATRLETRETALAAIRRVADKAPAELVLPTLRILMRRDAMVDWERIEALAKREPANSDAAVMKYVKDRQAEAKPEK